jgi:ribonucleoside-diphosphate reductase alpha chain
MAGRQPIELTHQNLYVKSNRIRYPDQPYLAANSSRDQGLGHDPRTTRFQQQIERIPQELKELYATRFEVDTGGSLTQPSPAIDQRSR